MIKNVWTLVGFLAIILLAPTIQAQKKTKTTTTKKAPMEGLFAVIKTTKGDMTVKFFDKESPVTVANFIGLAEGKIKNSARPLGKPFYDSLIFHRVIKNFMIQGGCPLGNGTGDPGYKFDDEKNNLKHDGIGYLSMANSGPNTNGSQFFITEVATPWLDGKHTIFGKVIEGLDVISKIAESPKDDMDKPTDNVYILSVKIQRKGAKYKNYDPVKVFEEGKEKIKAANEKLAKEKEAKNAILLEEKKKGMMSTPSGLYYMFTQKTDNELPKDGDKVSVHYTLRLLDGTKIDSSYDRNQTFDFELGKSSLIPGWVEGVKLFPYGSKGVLLIPPALGYGNRDMMTIPANSWLVFDLEVIGKL